MRARLGKPYAANLKELRALDFDTTEFEQVQERDIEVRYGEFLEILEELIELYWESDRLWQEYPMFRNEFDELSAALKQLGEPDPVRELLLEKRTAFKVRHLIHNYVEISREFERARVEVMELEAELAEKDLNSFLTEVEGLVGKHFIETPLERSARLKAFAEKIQGRGLEETISILERLKELNSKLFDRLMDALEGDMEALEMISLSLDNKETSLPGSLDYHNIKRHRDDPSFIFLTIKRFVEMEMNTRAKILGK